MEQVCPICGSIFRPPLGRSRKTCSKSCGTTLGHQSRPKPPRPLCAFCGVNAVKYAHYMFCGTSCRGKARHKTCRVDGCEKRSDSRGLGMCRTHERRYRAGIDLSGVRKPMAEGERRVYSNGYVYLKIGDRRVAEHRLVMERILGRSLRSFETPHHKNGIKTDNSPANLELWTQPQPAGQRPEDLVAWVLDNYPDLVETEICARTGQLRLVADR